MSMDSKVWIFLYLDKEGKCFVFDKEKNANGY
jgi:hypothetical protein